MTARVTAVVPYHGAAPYLRQAVESLLGQTHRDLTVVVVNDGDPDPPWPLLADVDDPRLVRFDLAANRGRYFADQVVLASTPDPYYLVQDADDWSEPDRVERLLVALRRHHAVGAVSSRRMVKAGEQVRTEVWARLGTPLTPEFEHRATQQGLFRTDALRRVGGFHPGFRIGYDSLLVGLLEMIGPVTAVRDPLYVARIRPGSLTTAPRTGWGSPDRRAAVARLRALWGRAYGAYERYLDGGLDVDGLAAAVRDVVGASVGPAEAACVRREAARLRPLLPAAPADPARPPSPPAPAEAGPRTSLRVYDLVADDRLPFEGWQIGPTLAVELAEHLDRTRPRRMLQTGCGSATVVMAAHVARRGGELTVVDHDADRVRRTRERLALFGLDGCARVDTVALQDLRCPDGVTRPWYATERADPVDFALVDGPPVATGRAAALFALHPRWAPGGEIWLHDAQRDHERDCLALWRSHLRFQCVERLLDDRGVALLRRDAAPAPPAAAVPDGLAVSVLTGTRPHLLRRTVAALAATAPDLVERARITVLVNGDDPESDAFVRSLPFVDRVLRSPHHRMPTGPAASRVVAAAVAHPGTRYLLHLEDDWEVSTLDGRWLPRAAAILDAEPRVGQVRLRHRGERVRRDHMVTSAPIRWTGRDGHLVAPSAHWTFNPSLVRAADVAAAFPARSEEVAGRRFLASGLGSAQLTPGVFRHIG